MCSLLIMECATLVLTQYLLVEMIPVKVYKSCLSFLKVETLQELYSAISITKKFRSCSHGVIFMTCTYRMISFFLSHLYKNNAQSKPNFLLPALARHACAHTSTHIHTRSCVGQYCNIVVFLSYIFEKKKRNDLPKCVHPPGDESNRVSTCLNAIS